MGCFFSKKEAASWGKVASTVRRRRSPPPTEPEAPQEETVKEVLSETAKPRARPREEVKEEEVGLKKCSKAGPGLNSINSVYNERFEENFEIRSMSEGFSVSTTVTEKREGEEGDAEEVEGKATRTREEKSPAKLQRKRSVSGELSRNQERSTGVGVGVGVGCRSGRSSPSPVKRREGNVRRTYSAKEAGQGRAARSRVPAENGFRRDPGERSNRRSVSPAAKRTAELRKATIGGQCKIVPASRSNGRASPSRIPPVAAAVAAADGDGKRVQEASGGDGGEGKESLENPLVSLECFIFL